MTPLDFRLAASSEGAAGGMFLRGWCGLGSTSAGSTSRSGPRISALSTPAVVSAPVLAAGAVAGLLTCIRLLRPRPRREGLGFAGVTAFLLMVCECSVPRGTVRVFVGASSTWMLGQCPLVSSGASAPASDFIYLLLGMLDV